MSPSATTVADFLTQGDDYEALLKAAEERAEGHTLNFVLDMWEKWEAYGMRAFLSEGQYDYLRRLAGEEG